MSQAQWLRLPAELRARPQWLLAAPNAKGELKVPATVGPDGRLGPGSSTDRSTWLDFDYACECALEHGFGIGYVLAGDDPFTCVDYDVKNHHNAPDNPELWTTPEVLAGMRAQVEDLASYTEQSISGQGVHVWVRAKFDGPGIKRLGVEVYCRERSIVCTGRPVHALPVEERQDDITQLVTVMRAAQAAGGVQRAEVLTSSEQELPDEEVMRRAWNADNATKFRELWEGRWQALGYPSQSEADLSLMSMLTFYSRDNEQCRRLFRNSALGQRDKATKDDRYLNYTLRLIRGRQAKEDALVAQQEAQAAQYVARMAAAPPAPGAAPAPAVGLLVGPQPAPAKGNGHLPPLEMPPGFAGDIARFIYNHAHRQVTEVAIVAALGLLAGMCGKGWVIPGSGLNCYIILAGRSGIGKEAMHMGLGAIMHRLRTSIPGADNFVVFTEFASGQALTKACAGHPSFVNVASEFGKKLKKLATEGDSNMAGLRTVMTALYQKSGPTSLVGGIAYSNKENNVGTVNAVAYSMIGESTPDDLYECLTESMMRDGFLSRFTIIETHADRPPANPAPEPFPSKALTDRLAALCQQALTLIHNNRQCYVQRTAEAAAAMDAYDRHCDAQINATEDESKRQMWNRAYLKAARIAALLAAADNCMEPVVDVHHFAWAADVIMRDIAVMQRRMATGDVGTTDHSRIRKVTQLVREYIAAEELPASYGVPEDMRRAGLVPHKYIQVRTAQLTLFNNHKLGAKKALGDTVHSMCENGYLSEADRAKVGEQYGFHGKCYRILDLPLN